MSCFRGSTSLPLFAITYAIIRPRIFRHLPLRPLPSVPETRRSYNTSPRHFREARPFRRGGPLKKKADAAVGIARDHLGLKFLKPREKRRSCDVTSRYLVVLLFILLIIFSNVFLDVTIYFRHRGKLIREDTRECLRGDCLPNEWMEFNIRFLPEPDTLQYLVASAVFFRQSEPELENICLRCAEEKSTHERIQKSVFARKK